MKITDVLQELGIHYRASGQYTRDGWLQMRCPHCAGGRDPNKLYAGYAINTGIVNCWRCGPHNAATTLALLSNTPVARVRELLGHLAPTRRSDTFRPRGRLKVPYGVGPLKNAHVTYLRDRGFNHQKLVRLWNLGGIGVAPKLQWRVYIPITYRGNVTSWTTRAIKDREGSTRYISASPQEESWPHKETLYGADYARHSVVCVEGPTGVWRFGPGTVATLGTSYTPAQVLALSRFAGVALCYDPEPAAQQRARRLADALAAIGVKTANIVLDGGDPGTATPRDVKRIRRIFLND